MPIQLKSLELHGYKTFANRTLFEFAGSVTAIVGPNGSGKSNIADSLRWVLGEQSYSLLRAKKTEDMIFSGSEVRPRAGMASATITFSNEDGWLPIDFSEVAITRRAYRDGQNEYLINGQRMRLKDVSELLSQSGLAERTYTVIGQGLVDAALSLKAEERRRLFEEAAGVGLHRSRREEALRRLENTRRNLERVEDILSELQPRLRSLERQARRVQEYEQIKADLQVYLREWYGYHFHRTQNELTRAQSNATVQEERLNQARASQLVNDKKLSEKRARIQEARQKLDQYRLDLAELRARREMILRDLAVSAERQRAIHQQLETLQTQHLNSSEELELLREQLEASEQEVLRIQSDLKEATRQAEMARQELSRHQAERDQADERLRQIRQKIGGLNAQHGQMEARIVEKKAQQERTRQALQQAQRALNEAETERLESDKKLKLALEIEEQAFQVYQQAQAASREHNKKIESLEHEIKGLERQKATLSAELEKTRARWEVLLQAESSLSGYASGTKILLEAANKKGMFGAKGVFSSYLQVPAELEIAIAAALGEYLDAVVLEDGLEHALDLLVEKAGNGVILPVRDMRTLPVTSDKPISSDVLGIASQLVQASENLKPALDLLLGQTWVVRDRKTARQVLQKASPGTRAVTLRGEVFDASGPVHVFSAGEPSGAATLLGRNRQQKELKSLLADETADLEALETKSNSLQDDWQNQTKHEQALKKAQEEAQKALDQSDKTRQQALLHKEQVERQFSWLKEQLANFQAELDSGQVGILDLSRKLIEVDEELALSRDEQRQQSALVETFVLDEFQANQAHWNTLQMVSEKSLADASLRQQERSQACLRQEKNLQSMLDLKTRLLADLDKLVEEQKGLHVEEEQLSQELARMQASIEPGEMDLRQLEIQLAEFEKEETDSRQVLNTAEHLNAQARINLARTQESLDSLRRRIEDDFGLVAFEYADQVTGPTPLPLEGMVEQLPRIEHLSVEVEESIKRQRAQLRRIGPINMEAQNEYQEVKQRFDFLTEQMADLKKAEEDVHQVIAELDQIIEQKLFKTFEEVAGEFKEIFMRLFGGGSARLMLTDPDDLTNTGIDIEARLPGRRTQGLALLSGGERSLTATALIFALLRVSPTPFCVLDEVDAMLDEANVGRFRELLRELSVNTQFVIVTHNRNTVQVADVIYGVTMGRDSASQVLSLKLDDVSQIVND